MIGEWKKIALLMAYEMNSHERIANTTSFEVLAAATFFKNLNVTRVTPNRSSACQTLSKLWMDGLLIKRSIPNRNGMVAYSLTPQGLQLAEAIIQETNSHGQIMREDTMHILSIAENLQQERRQRNRHTRINIRSLTQGATINIRCANTILKTYQKMRKTKLDSMRFVCDAKNDDKINNAPRKTRAT